MKQFNPDSFKRDFSHWDLLFPNLLYETQSLLFVFLLHCNCNLLLICAVLTNLSSFLLYVLLHAAVTCKPHLPSFVCVVVLCITGESRCWTYCKSLYQICLDQNLWCPTQAEKNMISQIFYSSSVEVNKWDKILKVKSYILERGLIITLIFFLKQLSIDVILVKCLYATSFRVSSS